MNSLTPGIIKAEIILQSLKDTIEGVEFESYDTSFLPRDLFKVLINNIKPFPNMSQTAVNYNHVVAGLSDFKNYTEDIYWYINKLLLYLEHFQCVMKMRELNLYNQNVQLSQHKNQFIIRIPESSNDQLSLRRGDKVILAPVKNSRRSEGTIKSVRKDHISVRFLRDFQEQFDPHKKYNIEFQYCDWDIKNLNHVLDIVYAKNLAPMLFPVKQSSYIKKKLSLQWINDNIKHNKEQQQTVMNILNKTASPAPYILFGPPGTGKTSTLVEAVYQILKYNSFNRILICTPSNAASDEIVIRLSKYVSDSNIMYRMYAASKNVDTINKTVKSFSNFADSEPVYISKHVFLRKKIVITTLTSCIRLYKYRLREDHFSYLFCDEAGQATEMDTLIPLLLMSGSNSNNVSQFRGQIILAGDPKQLGPFVSSRLAEPLLGKSMLERLMERTPYNRNSETNEYDPMYVTKLVQNYRSHPAILYLPNKLFYNEELICKADASVRYIEKWSKLQSKQFPLIFHAVKGEEKREADSTSICNYNELGVVIRYVKQLLNSRLDGKTVTHNDIGIITPYRLQKFKIHKALEIENIRDISIGTVETYQGQERDIIIISTVRTKLYMSGGCVHIGHLSNPKRFNVAITRARALLIVIGDPRILEHDIYWRSFMQYCIDNKSCKGHQFELHHQIGISQIRELIAKKHTVNKTANSESKPIEKSSDSESDNTEDENENRRRRLPIGPLPEKFRHSSNCQIVYEITH